MTNREFTATLREFADWASTKSGPYQTANNCKCPMADFAREKYGFDDPEARSWSVMNGPSSKHGFDRLEITKQGRTFLSFFGHIVSPGEQTYEAMTQRAYLEP